jgi:hypothetical protein
VRLQFHKGALGKCGTLDPYNVPFLQQKVLHHLQTHIHPNFNRDVPFSSCQNSLIPLSLSCSSSSLVCDNDSQENQSEFADRQQLLLLEVIKHSSFPVHLVASCRKGTAWSTHEVRYTTLWAKGNTPNRACRSCLLQQQTPALHSDWFWKSKNCVPQTALGNQSVMTLHSKQISIQTQLSVYPGRLHNSFATA